MSNQSTSRDIEDEAHLWASLTTTPYDSALRAVSDPRSLGALGDRVSVRDLLEALEQRPDLGMYGFTDEPLLREGRIEFQGSYENLLHGVLLSVEVLRLLAPESDSGDAHGVERVHSGALKHVAEDFLKPLTGTISNGQLIWAAAAIGMSMKCIPGVRDAEISVASGYYTYTRQVVRNEGRKPRSHHNRPPQWDRLRSVLGLPEIADARPVAGELARMQNPGEYPFFDYLRAQARGSHPDPVGRFLRDYFYGVSMNEDPIARTPEELMLIFAAPGFSEDAYDALEIVIRDWEQLHR
ncbi:MAG: hypothetical protein ACTJHM_03750 [Agrococcus casei]|uniref:hypothetical protein n=1 Tax=Agrococcus casei TaxID=343512 RepID=UPI003F91AECE